jgi:hypothetical protein
MTGRRHPRSPTSIEELLIFARQSNLIEGVTDTGEWLDRHFHAALHVEAAARHGILLPSPVLHDFLFTGLMASAGQYRPVDVYVGDHTRVIYRCPPHALVEPLMEAWHNAAHEYAYDYTGPFLTQWDAHHAFESIHPFVDGNGRVGRLLLNSIQRIQQGYWITVLDAEKEDYYDGIQLWRARPEGLKAFLTYADVSPWEGLELP